MAGVGTFARLLRANWVLAREGVIAALPGEALEGLPRLAWNFARLIAKRRVAGTARTDRIAKAVARLGPSYAKLGQFLATRADVIGLDMARDMAGLLDKMESFPTAEAKAAIEASLGGRMEDHFAEFGEPIAAASIAQVHPAWVEDAQGRRKVAVKVIRPGVREQFRKNNAVFMLAAQIQDRAFASSKRLKPIEVARTLEATTRLEMDLRIEAAALSEMADYTKNDADFRVPKVDWDRTGRDVLTMEWIDGIPLTNMAAVQASGIDLSRLGVTVMQSFLRHALRDGFFHADMHPGNLFVQRDGTLVMLDLGIMGRIGRKERRFLAEILYGFLRRDYRRVAEVHFEAGYVPADQDVASFAQALRAVGEPIYGQPAETISIARLLTLLFEITDLFNMATRTELLLLQKTMVVAEGVARALGPHFNMWEASKPVIEEWIRDNLGPKALVNDAREGLHATANLIRRGPELAERFEALAAEADRSVRDGFRFDAETAERIGRAEAKAARSGRIALWVIAVTLVAIAVRMW
jgi:ubiquinone biosynthesis protein